MPQEKTVQQILDPTKQAESSERPEDEFRKLLSAKETQDAITNTINSVFTARFQREVADLKTALLSEVNGSLDNGLKPLMARFEAFSGDIEDKKRKLTAAEQEKLETDKRLRGLEEQVKAANEQAAAARDRAAQEHKRSAIQKVFAEHGGKTKTLEAVMPYLNSVVQGDAEKGFFMDLPIGVNGEIGRLPLDKAMEKWLDTEVGSHFKSPVGAAGAGIVSQIGSSTPTPSNGKSAKDLLYEQMTGRAAPAATK